MTTSEDDQGMPFGTYEDYLGREPEPEPEPEVVTPREGETYAQMMARLSAEDDTTVLGVLTGQYPARTMPIATSPEDPDNDDGSA